MPPKSDTRACAGKVGAADGARKHQLRKGYLRKGYPVCGPCTAGQGIPCVTRRDAP